MNKRMTVLQSGKCEPLKAVVHGIALGTAALCGAYNFAAWLTRRQKHLAINSVLYSAVVVWEYTHVRHHLAAKRRVARPRDAASTDTSKVASSRVSAPPPTLNVRVPVHLVRAVGSSNGRERQDAIEQIVQSVCGEWLRQQGNTGAIDERLRIRVEPITGEEHEAPHGGRVASGDPRM